MINCDLIRQACAEATGYPEELIFSPDLHAPLPWIRACAAHLAREEGFGWQKIADELNINSHSTAVVAKKRFLARYGEKTYPFESEIYRRIENALKTKKNGLQTNQGV